MPLAAALDLGSNSFHLLVAELDGARVHVVDRLRERVALADGIETIEGPVAARALACLSRFGERLRSLPPARVRAVGTSAFRKAKNARAFAADAEAALGFPIDIVAGQEEARLIYLGVAHSVAHDGARRLVIDIGGGSTELIVGDGFDPIERDSLTLGCVTWTREHFGDGRLSAAAFRRARTGARLLLRGLERTYREAGWARAFGSSGTVRAVGEVLREHDVSDGTLTPAGLEKLAALCVDAGRIDRLRLRGAEPDRLAVLPGGLAILIAAFEALEIPSMAVSAGAMREGILWDLLGRLEHSDVRDLTIRGLQDRHRADRAQAGRVEKTALEFFAQVAAAWALPPGSERWLQWAAQLHEIGLSVSHSGFHKHGAYLIRNGDLPGFSRDDQDLVAAIVRGHRRQIGPTSFDEHVAPQRRALATRLTVLLRLAARLHRSRAADAVPREAIGVEAAGDALTLTFPARWLDARPLTQADLLDEATMLVPIGVVLGVRATPEGGRAVSEEATRA